MHLRPIRARWLVDGLFARVDSIPPSRQGCLGFSRPLPRLPSVPALRFTFPNMARIHPLLSHRYCQSPRPIHDVARCARMFPLYPAPPRPFGEGVAGALRCPLRGCRTVRLARYCLPSQVLPRSATCRTGSPGRDSCVVGFDRFVGSLGAFTAPRVAQKSPRPLPRAAVRRTRHPDVIRHVQLVGWWLSACRTATQIQTSDP